MTRKDSFLSVDRLSKFRQKICEITVLVLPFSVLNTLLWKESLSPGRAFVCGALRAGNILNVKSNNMYTT